MHAKAIDGKCCDSSSPLLEKALTNVSGETKRTFIRPAERSVRICFLCFIDTPVCKQAPERPKGKFFTFFNEQRKLIL